MLQHGRPGRRLTMNHSSQQPKRLINDRSSRSGTERRLPVSTLPQLVQPWQRPSRKMLLLRQKRSSKVMSRGAALCQNLVAQSCIIQASCWVPTLTFHQFSPKCPTYKDVKYSPETGCSGIKRETVMIRSVLLACKRFRRQALMGKQR